MVALRQPGLAVNAPNQRHPLSHDQGGHSISAPPGRLHRRRGGQLLAALRLQVLPITPEIALLIRASSQPARRAHQRPAFKIQPGNSRLGLF